MKRFAAFEDSALEARLERLRRSAVDLQDRVHARMAEAEREGRWVPSDSLYQRLSSLLKQVREHLQQTQQEHERRLELRGERAAQTNGPGKRLEATARGPARRSLPRGPKQPAAAHAAATSGS
jgi:hypothetical protein